MSAHSALQARSALQLAPRAPARSTQNTVQEAHRLAWLAQRASSAQMLLKIQFHVRQGTSRQLARELAQSAQQAHTASQPSAQMVMLYSVDQGPTLRPGPPDAKSALLARPVRAMVAKMAL